MINHSATIRSEDPSQDKGHRVMKKSRYEILEEAVALVNKSELSSIKQVVTEIIRIMSDERSSAKELKEIIERDPPLCSRLLKRVNSAAYGFPRTVSDIQDAIVFIGFDVVKELALSQKVCDIFRREVSFNGYSRQSLWRHCFAVAICSKMIYRREFRQRGDNVYVAGLLHELGIIVEDQFFPEQFRQALEISGPDKNNLHIAEKLILGVDHADIGRAIAENWAFPEELSQAIGAHHEPILDSDEDNRVALTVFVADYILQREDIGYADAPCTDEILVDRCLSILNIQKQ
ncbi:MAG: HDOD domain-containing protein, partial [Gemmatimonadota bacterium]|nr:HDOD domain-containing protein [Gemmatimonadota bacterium]